MFSNLNFVEFSLLRKRHSEKMINILVIIKVHLIGFTTYNVVAIARGFAPQGIGFD